jgi:glycosyltransferase involved in cell wall biosynthesis
MIKLSVLIPTFNRRDRLKNSLSNYTEEKINSVEFLVIDNCSNDGTEDLVQLMIKEDNRIKYFKNPQNLGYNRNLFRGYLEANSNWICILPDDDAIEKGFLSELVEFINNNPKSSLILPAQKNEDNHIKNLFFTKTTKLDGKEAFKLAFKASGAVTGFTFNKLSLDQKQWNLDNSIYPQIRIALNLALENDVTYFKPQHCPIIRFNDDIMTMTNDAMNRPKDFGVFERIKTLNDVSKRINSEKLKTLFELEIGLYFWATNLALQMSERNENYSKAYIKHLFTNKILKKSAIFIAISFVNLVLKKGKKDLNYILLAQTLKALPSALFSLNFYYGVFFLLTNLKKHYESFRKNI